MADDELRESACKEVTVELRQRVFLGVGVLANSIADSKNGIQVRFWIGPKIMRSISSSIGRDDPLRERGEDEDRKALDNKKLLYRDKESTSPQKGHWNLEFSSTDEWFYRSYRAFFEYIANCSDDSDVGNVHDASEISGVYAHSFCARYVRWGEPGVPIAGPSNEDVDANTSTSYGEEEHEDEILNHQRSGTGQTESAGALMDDDDTTTLRRDDLLYVVRSRRGVRGTAGASVVVEIIESIAEKEQQIDEDEEEYKIIDLVDVDEDECYV
ncbi:hypothetical protein F5887DRAFT_925053 [Amanita rubescens]|nr:hypothetical protein F5887DRAFT_925053 [Amanita rubescens]